MLPLERHQCSTRSLAALDQNSTIIAVIEMKPGFPSNLRQKNKAALVKPLPGDVRVDVDRRYVGSDRLVTPDPVALVLCLEAEGRGQREPELQIG